MKRQLNTIPLLVAIALLGGLAVDTLSRPRAEQAEEYHAKVVQAVKDMEEIVQFDGWVGDNEEVPAAAFKLLKPNTIYSRRFVNVRLGLRVAVLVVHCKDARYIDGHYPPVCYPAHGWESGPHRAKDWTADGVTFTGTEYVFTKRLSTASQSKLVANFILSPGKIARDMSDVGTQAADYTRRFHGAAQVQVVFDDAELPESERDQIVQLMLQKHMPILQSILTEVTPNGNNP